ncbi:MAG: ABC transporter permease [Armatimonadetes bacterium]|nr:ABC transporter permease [Armatimonadota bacterium]
MTRWVLAAVSGDPGGHPVPPAIRGHGLLVRFLRQPGAVVGTLLVAVFAAMALAGPRLQPYDPLEPSDANLLGPSRARPMGTDELGRDVFSQFLSGAQVSLLFAFGAAGASLAIGVLVGALSGSHRGWVDDLLSRAMDIFLIIPRLFLIILLVAMFGSNLWIALLVVGGTMWPANARLMRAQVLAVGAREFVAAALASGVPGTRVLTRHVVPNALDPVLANVTLQMAYAALTEASLSFLGLGDPNRPSWGRIIASGQQYVLSAWWMVVFPGLALALLLLALHLVGDGLAAALNPRMGSRVR